MWSRSIIASSLALAASLELASAARGSPQLETTVPMSASAFARLARSQEFYRSTRASGDLSKQEVVELGDWVQWEFQHEDDESPLAGEDVNEVVPSPPAGMKGEAGLALKGVKGGGLKGSKAAAAGAGRHSGGEDEQGLQQQGTEEAHQMYRKVRLKYAVSSPIGSSHSEGAQGHTLREGKDEVIYTETDCISGLPMFRGDLVVKTTYRVTPSEEDPDNSVVVKVSVVVRDVKLARAAGWLGRAVKVMVRDSGKKQAASTLKQMVEAKSGTWA